MITVHQTKMYKALSKDETAQLQVQCVPANYYGVCVVRPAESCAGHSSYFHPRSFARCRLCMLAVSVSASLLAVMHAFSRVREEQVRRDSVSCNGYIFTA